MSLVIRLGMNELDGPVEVRPIAAYRRGSRDVALQPLAGGSIPFEVVVAKARYPVAAPSASAT